MIENPAFLQRFQKPELFVYKKYGIHQSPEHKIPCRSVPDSRRKPDNKNIEKPTAFSDPVSAERNVQVIPEPASERNMPSSPEFRDTSRNIRIIKVFRKPEAENAPESDCHIAVTGKVKIDLKRTGDRIKPEEQNRFFSRIFERGHQLGKDIRNQNLLGKTDREPSYAVSGVFHAVRSVFKLRGNIRIAYNGSGDKLREHGNIQSEINIVSLRRHVSPVYIDRIA